MTVSGKIEFIETAKRISDKLTKRMVVVTTADKYPQSIPIELVNDKCALVDNAKIGDDITVHVNIRGRKWINPQGDAKYFCSIEGWRVELVSATPQSSASSTPTTETDNSNLPF